MVRPGGDALQVVLGPIADQVAGEIRAGADELRRPRKMLTSGSTAFGGAANVEDLQQRSSRLIMRSWTLLSLDERALKSLGRTCCQSGPKATECTF